MKKKYLLTLLPFLSAPVMAEGFSLDIHGLSYHFDRTRERNETNEGLGLTYTRKDSTFFSIGQYQNSHWMASRYISAGKAFHLSPSFSYGFEFGLVDGYRFADEKPIPFITPHVQYGPAKLRLIPKNHGALGLSFSFPLKGGL